MSVPILLLAALILSASACGARDGASARPVYVAIGASDSVGVGAANEETEGWVPRLHATMPEGTRLINLGVSGSTLREALDEQLPVALSAEPDVVTVWLAVNDFKNGVPLASYQRDLDILLGRLRETGALVLVGNIPDLTQLPIPDQALRAYGFPDRAAIRSGIQQWNGAIERIAREHDAVLVDLYSQWRELAAHPEYIGADGFHPSTQGYARLSELWEARLRTAQRAGSASRP